VTSYRSSSPGRRLACAPDLPSASEASPRCPRGRIAFQNIVPYDRSNRRRWNQQSRPGIYVRVAQPCPRRAPPVGRASCDLGPGRSCGPSCGGGTARQTIRLDTHRSGTSMSPLVVTPKEGLACPKGRRAANKVVGDSGEAVRTLCTTRAYRSVEVELGSRRERASRNVSR
jgi:hypothetical protein